MKKKVLLFLAEGFETYESGVFIDVIGWNLVLGDTNTELFTCGMRKEIKSSFNQKQIVDFLIDEIDVHSFDALAIPGGFEVYDFYKDAYNEKFLDLIRQFKTNNKVIATICVASLPVAKSGVLKGKNGTTYNSPVRRDALRNFGVEVIDQPVVIDDNIITSCNPSSGIEVALLLLELLTTKENADKIRQLMGY